MFLLDFGCSSAHGDCFPLLISRRADFKTSNGLPKVRTVTSPKPLPPGFHKGTNDTKPVQTPRRNSRNSIPLASPPLRRSLSRDAARSLGSFGAITGSPEQDSVTSTPSPQKPIKKCINFRERDERYTNKTHFPHNAAASVVFSFALPNCASTKLLNHLPCNWLQTSHTWIDDVRLGKGSARGCRRLLTTTELQRNPPGVLVSLHLVALNVPLAPSAFCPYELQVFSSLEVSNISKIQMRARNCRRTFKPDSLQVHMRGCHPPQYARAFSVRASPHSIRSRAL